MNPNTTPVSRFAAVASTSLALACSSVSALSADDLFFSEYVEGSGSNKALELYNGTGGDVDLSADAYDVQIFANGASVATQTIPLTNTVVAGDVYVVALSGANAAIVAEADLVNPNLTFNGDDSVVLRKNEVVVDSIGQIGFDPGTEWGVGLVSTADNTLRRMLSVTTGDTNTSDAFDPAVEWDGYSTDTFDGLGSYPAVAAKAFSIVRTETNTVAVFWPANTGTNWNLEVATNLTAGAWTQVPPPFQTNVGTVYFVDSPSLDKKYYRLQYAPGQATNVLFFSEYVEGSSLNKAVEIYNSGTGAEDLAAGSYAIQIYANGSATPMAPIALSGTVAGGDVFVVAVSGADAAIIAQADMVNSLLNFNGDDAVLLLKNGAVVDSIGQVAFDPGTEWGSGLTSTADNTLRRKLSVTVGDTNPADVYDPSVEWDGYATDTFGGLGLR